MPLLSEVPKPEPAASAEEPSPSELVRVLQRQLEQMAAVMERQTAIIDRLLGAPGLPVALPADTLTIGELWLDYVRHLGNVPWIHVARSQAVKVLAHFAPSVCYRAEKGRRSTVRVYGPDMLVSAIKLHHWQSFMSELKLREPRLQVGTRRLIVARMRAMFRWATKNERIAANPLQFIEMERGRPKRQTRVTEEYLERLKPHASPVAWAYILTICDSGVRPGEARIIKHRDINRETLRVEIHWSDTKGKKTRPVWLTERVLEAYEAVPRRPDNPYVFASPRPGKPYSKIRLWEMFRAAADAAGLEPAPLDRSVRAHDGRRDHATKLIRSGVSLPVVQGILGHANIKTTMGYVDVEEADLEAAHGKLAASKRKGAHPKKPPES